MNMLVQALVDEVIRANNFMKPGSQLYISDEVMNIIRRFQQDELTIVEVAPNLTNATKGNSDEDPDGPVHQMTAEFSSDRDDPEIRRLAFFCNPNVRVTCLATADDTGDTAVYLFTKPID